MRMCCRAFLQVLLTAACQLAEVDFFPFQPGTAGRWLVKGGLGMQASALHDDAACAAL